MIELLNANSLQIPLADKSVQCVVTSPPYWALRDYGTATWLGGDPACDHFAPPRGGVKKSTLSNIEFDENGYTTSKTQTNKVQYFGTCKKCGAERVDLQLGLEASPFDYIERTVEVFREVWRVLRDDGTLWLNIGDSYSNAGTRQGDRDGAVGSTINAHRVVGNGYRPTAPGLKNKDLVGIPWRLAFALQADGWYLRSDIIWAKPNPMPESVTDRPTKAHEYIFLLTKNERYFYDAEAIKEPSVYPDDNRKARSSESDKRMPTGLINGIAPGSATYPTRNRRTVWNVPSYAYSGAHFATFPPALVEPMIKAGSRTGDIVLDPFVGSGTTLQVARKLGRSGIGLDLSFTYLRDCARERLSLTALDEWENGAPSVGGIDTLPLFEGMNL